MSDGASLSLHDASLAVALTVSIAAHVAVFAALGQIEGDLPPGSRVPGAVAPTLEARLVTLPVANLGGDAPRPDSADSRSMPIDAIPNPAADIALPPPVAHAAASPSPPDAARPTSTVGTAEREIAVVQSPRVVLDTTIPRARFGGTFDNGALDEFPGEVDAAVGIPDRIEIPYPPGALATGQEATVIAWAVIDQNGAVESTHVVDGPPEFSDAVESALARTAFIPARNKGTAIRFYVMLAIDFRIDAGGSVAVDKAATAR